MLRKGMKGVLIAFVVGALTVMAGLGIATAGGGYDGYLKAFGVQKPKKEIKAPDFALKDQDGKSIGLSDYKGKVVFLNFFATWCAPCFAEMPQMSRVYNKFAERDFVILGVGVLERAEQLKGFRKDLEITFPTVADEEGIVAARYSVRGLPVSYLIDREGYIIGGWVGGRDWDGEIAYGLVEALLEDSKKN